MTLKVTKRHFKPDLKNSFANTSCISQNTSEQTECLEATFRTICCFLHGFITWWYHFPPPFIFPTADSTLPPPESALPILLAGLKLEIKRPHD